MKVHTSSDRSSRRHERERGGHNTERADFRDGRREDKDVRERSDYGREARRGYGEERSGEYGKKRSRHDVKRTPGMLTY